MKVYLVICVVAYESQDVYGVYSTQALADAVAEKLRDKEKFSFDRVRVDVEVLDQDDVGIA